MKKIITAIFDIKCNDRKHNTTDYLFIGAEFTQYEPKTVSPPL